MSKQRDMKMLRELRRGPLSRLSSNEYDMIETMVEEMGLDGLSGYARSVVEDAKRKMSIEFSKAKKALDEKKNQFSLNQSRLVIKFLGALQAVEPKVEFYELNAQAKSMFLIHLLKFKELKMTPQF